MFHSKLFMFKDINYTTVECFNTKENIRFHFTISTEHQFFSTSTSSFELTRENLIQNINIDKKKDTLTCISEKHLSQLTMIDNHRELKSYYPKWIGRFYRQCGINIVAAVLLYILTWCFKSFLLSLFYKIFDEKLHTQNNFP